MDDGRTSTDTGQVAGEGPWLMTHRDSTNSPYHGRSPPVPLGMRHLSRNQCAGGGRRTVNRDCCPRQPADSPESRPLSVDRRAIGPVTDPRSAASTPVSPWFGGDRPRRVEDGASAPDGPRRGRVSNTGPGVVTATVRSSSVGKTWVWGRSTNGVAVLGAHP